MQVVGSLVGERRAAGSSGPEPSLPGDGIWPEGLSRVLTDASQPRLVYQPIVDLQRGAVVGYEALSRFDGPPFAPPDTWFALAARAGAGAELEARAVRSALGALPKLPPNCFLTVNVSPSQLCSPAVAAVLDGAGALAPLVLELTEQVELVDYGEVRATLDRYRAKGMIVAVDDAGDGYAGLQRLLQVRPEMVKLDRSLVADADRDEAQRALAEMVGSLAGRLDAWLLVEGVERPRQLEAFIRMGVPLGQGTLLGPPSRTFSTALPPQVAAVFRHARAHVVAGAQSVLGLVELAPSVWADRVAEAGRVFQDNPDADIAVVVDERERPIGLLQRADALAQRPWRRPVQCVAPSTGVAELAARSMTRPPATRFDPSACCDGRGRYLGLVRVERMVQRLATTASEGEKP